MKSLHSTLLLIFWADKFWRNVVWMMYEEGMTHSFHMNSTACLVMTWVVLEPDSDFFFVSKLANATEYTWVLAKA
jgi:hypothetical protein